MRRPTVLDLAGVIYSSGKVFDGLRTGRLDTENFLRSGSLDGVSSRADLALLEDLRDVAQFIVTQVGTPVDAAYVRAINARITRSGALHPGSLRTADQRIGVDTPLGRHEPAALTESGLQEIVDRASGREPAGEAAISLFVELAKAQPFEDGNKRTALFAANGLLIARAPGLFLSIPTDEDGPGVERTFVELLARAYVRGDDHAVKALLREHGLTASPEQAITDRRRRFPELFGKTESSDEMLSSRPEPER